MKSDAPLAAENARSRKKRIGSIGSFVRSSQPTNAARITAPTTSEPTICGLVQPSEFPFTRPQTRPSSPSPPRTTPGTSSALVRAVRLAQLRREREQDQPDRDVQPEDPLPGDPFDDGAADERPHRDGEARDAGPRTERGAAAFGATRRRSGS